MQNNVLNGIDVSVINGDIDWKSLKEQGIQFAMIKATQGHGLGIATQNLRLFTDSRFSENIRTASKEGILCGAYHYFTATSITEAEEEANYFISVLKREKDYVRLWAAVDVEDTDPPRFSGRLSKSQLTACTRRFIERIRAAGYQAMLYTNPNYLTYKFTPSAFEDVDIWLAHYNVNTPMTIPRLKIWQYTPSGRIDGIAGDADLNRGYFTLEERDPVDAIINACGFMPMWRARMKEFEERYEFGDEFWRRIANEL